MFNQLSDTELNTTSGGRIGPRINPLTAKPRRIHPGPMPSQAPRGPSYPGPGQLNIAPSRPGNGGMSTGKKAGIGAGAAIITAAATAGILKAEDVI